MTEAYVSLNGVRATAARVVIPRVGVWLVDLDFDSSQPELLEVPLGATVVIGPATLIGTIDVEHTGNFAEKGRVRVRGGAGGWRKTAKARHFHNDAGVKASTVLLATAAEVGETWLGPPTTALGVDYVRSAGAAARVAYDLAPDGWRVDLDGVTRTGLRPRTEPPSDVYDLHDFDPRGKIATVSIDDLTKVLPGAVLTSRLSRPLTLLALELGIEHGSARARVWGSDG